MYSHIKLPDLLEIFENFHFGVHVIAAFSNDFVIIRDVAKIRYAAEKFGCVNWAPKRVVGQYDIGVVQVQSIGRDIPLAIY
ncbi:hypothetical protein A7D25_12005 [Pseudomonas sp. 21C1]|nr:hypothetical protein A7D25_12005 [Pseudomonas sp. 21C1]